MSLPHSLLTASLGPLASTLGSEELSALAESLTTYGLRCIRPRPTVSDAELPFEVAPVPWSPLGRFLVNSEIRPGSLLNFAAGDYAVQDAASLLPLTLMQLRAGQRVIDCCAAPGGKSAAILEQLKGTGFLVSNEVIASRVETLQLTLARTGASNYMLTHQPVDRLAVGMGEQFDVVLVDAPCTGQSLVSRDKQSLSAFSDHQIAHSAARQRTILESAIDLVSPGGRLVYSTCTFAYHENEAILAWLRERLPSWQPVVLPELSSWQTPGFEGCYRLWPHRDRCAGGFAAALIRPAEQTADQHTDQHTDGTMRTRQVVYEAARKSSSAWQLARDTEFLDAWSRNIDRTVVYEHKQQLAIFVASVPPSWHRLAYCGVEVATKFGQHWQPAYPVAVLDSGSSALYAPKERTELTYQEALTYFSGTSLHRVGPVGWQVVTWQAHPLGWAKQVGTQLKNHLPKPLRQPNLR